MLATAANAQHARVLRAMRQLKPRASEMELRVWLGKHIRERQDMQFSRDQEVAWAPYMPGAVGEKSGKVPRHKAPVTALQAGSSRPTPTPLFPGEVRAHEEDVRSITRQNVRNLAESVLEGSHQFRDQQDLLLRFPELDLENVQVLIGSLFPDMDAEDTNALARRFIEALQLDPLKQSNERKQFRMITADILQLQGYPQTFAAMMEAVGRRQESRMHKVIVAREQFFNRLEFKWSDLRAIRKNAQLIGKKFIDATPDIVDVVYELYREYIEQKKEVKEDANNVQPQQVHDQELQFAHATGYRQNSQAVCRIRENSDGNGRMSVNGSVPIAHFRGRIHAVEMLLQPFDECDLNVFEFDVDLEVFGGGDITQAEAMRVALSNALVKMLPHTRVYLNMASFLYPDPRQKPPIFPGERKHGARPYWNRRGSNRTY
eukprot:TRINITY_DN61243_c0_g1_i1.p1 TRINITY_DN61243_c0_g1~~TRINITY_DN61243_c0_g1_i1.p1  ORF type:complete len:469 (+),score=132.67 TRINITY_DN61243_c0_g1_i1:115-1407(+)